MLLFLFIFPLTFPPSTDVNEHSSLIAHHHFNFKSEIFKPSLWQLKAENYLIISEAHHPEENKTIL